MLSEPQIEFREKLPYLGIRKKVGMTEISKILPPLISEVFNWMSENDITHAGPPFFRYLSMDKNGDMLVDVGVPAKTASPGNDAVQSRFLPAGDFAVAIHTGHYENLKSAHMQLDKWINQNGYRETCTDEDGKMVGCRVESYVSDSDLEPDPDKWITELFILIKTA